LPAAWQSSHAPSRRHVPRGVCRQARKRSDSRDRATCCPTRPATSFAAPAGCSVSHHHWLTSTARPASLIPSAVPRHLLLSSIERRGSRARGKLGSHASRSRPISAGYELVSSMARAGSVVAGSLTQRRRPHLPVPDPEARNSLPQPTDVLTDNDAGTLAGARATCQHPECRDAELAPFTGPSPSLGRQRRQRQYRRWQRAGRQVIRRRPDRRAYRSSYRSRAGPPAPAADIRVRLATAGTCLRRAPRSLRAISGASQPRDRRRRAVPHVHGTVPQRFPIPSASLAYANRARQP